jgi:endonuclease/exonuclease/phosphatase family metal-dependent hydrolase
VAARDTTALGVLSWNLFHGRSLPPSRRSLHAQFAAMLAGWEWDVALLQEVPPWWPPSLARRAGAFERSVLTSRNSLPVLRRAIASRRPELMKSNGGGANAVLSRVPISEHGSLRLRVWPERRVAQLVRLQDGVCAANFHASARVPLARDELARLWHAALEFARGEPLVVGGDLNLRDPQAPPGVDAAHLARRDVDHVFARGLQALEAARTLDRRVELGGRSLELSDHPPLWVSARRLQGGGLT